VLTCNCNFDFVGLYSNDFDKIFFNIANDEEEPRSVYKVSKHATGNGKKDTVLEYIQAKREDEKRFEERRFAVEERRLALEEKQAEDHRIEREKFWQNAEAERQLQLEKLKVESEEKRELYNLIRSLKK